MKIEEMFCVGQDFLIDNKILIKIMKLNESSQTIAQSAKQN